MSRLGSIIFAVALCGVTAEVSFAAEPRPWLCRDIPVFSNSKPVSWHATPRGAGRWLMTFMHYDPSGGHDGFTVVSTKAIRGSMGGELGAGQYYAVALYSAGGHWICPGNASEDDSPEPGTIASLCYGEDDDSCDVKLVVKPSGSAPP
jgi:hypothetical protein